MKVKLGFEGGINSYQRKSTMKSDLDVCFVAVDKAGAWRKYLRHYTQVRYAGAWSGACDDIYLSSLTGSGMPDA